MYSMIIFFDLFFRDDGSYVLYGIILSADSLNLNLPQSFDKQVTVYQIESSQAPNQNLSYLAAESSTLNGKLLEWVSQQPLVGLNGRVQTLPVTLSGYSQFFIVIEQIGGKERV